MKNKKIRIVTEMVVIIVIILGLSGCKSFERTPAITQIPGETQTTTAVPSSNVTGSTSTSTATGSPKVLLAKDITDKIVSGVSFSSMTSLTDKQLQLFYYIDMTMVDDYCVLVSTDSSNSDEIAVIKARPGSESDVLNGVRDRFQSQKDGFKDYLPDQYAKLEKSVIKANGSYVFFVVCNNPSKATELFNECFN